MDYYVQHPISWAHREGKLNCTDAYIKCILLYLNYLTSVRLQLTDEGTASSGLWEVMQDNEAFNTLCILTNNFRFSSLKANKEMIGQLRHLGYYPIRREIGKYDWIRRIMNIYPLWMVLCCCYRHIPQKIGEKLIRRMSN